MNAVVHKLPWCVVTRAGGVFERIVPRTAGPLSLIGTLCGCGQTRTRSEIMGRNEDDDITLEFGCGCRVEVSSWFCTAEAWADFMLDATPPTGT